VNIRHFDSCEHNGLSNSHISVCYISFLVTTTEFENDKVSQNIALCLQNIFNSMELQSRRKINHSSDMDKAAEFFVL